MRKPHKKTRTGCTSCKARRIKCGEEKPECHNCTNREAACTYPSVHASNSQSLPQHRALVQRTTHQDRSDQDTSKAASTSSSYVGLHQPADHVSGMNMLHLELLHNFITSTCFTLSNNEISRMVWRIQIPRLALEFDFVMHSILALSALHLAQNPDRTAFYTAQADSLHQAGLRIATTILPNVSKDNASALWIFTGLTTLITLASPRQPEDILLVGESSIAEWLRLFRGNQSMVLLYRDVLYDGPLGAMFAAGKRRTVMQVAHANDQTVEADELEKLQRLVAENVTDSKILDHYTTAIDELRCCFNIAYAPGFQTYESADVFIWLFRVSDGYLNTLTERTQESLAIFAFFCVILKRFDGMWYINGWSSHLLTKIYRLLDEEHRLWIRWPIEETGVVLY